MSVSRLYLIGDARRVPESQGVEELINLIKADDRWVRAPEACATLGLLALNPSGSAVIMVFTKRLVLGAVTLTTVRRAGIHSPGPFVKAQRVDEVWQIIDHQYVDGTFNQVDYANNI